MEKILSGLVDGQSFISWLIMAFLFGYFVYKEWPEFQRRMGNKTAMEEKGKSLLERVATIEADVRDVKEKLDRDYRRINDVERELARHRKDQARDREEMEIIMKGVLAALQGLQQQGCNGPVGNTIDEINAYLNKKAHEPRADWEEDK